jgi:hypothetical protein
MLRAAASMLEGMMLYLLHDAGSMLEVQLGFHDACQVRR